jgi:cation diffusion facilitator CzcD-associated flavoprotein CzcO
MSELLDLPAAPTRPPAGDGADATPVRIAIVGSGFAGLGLAIRLEQAGIDDFVVLERADDVGGTWQANTYPGCQCDVPSHLYSFSFAQPALEPHVVAPARDLELPARPHGALRPAPAHPPRLRAARRRLGRRPLALARRDLAGAWLAQVLVDATGPLSHPQVPQSRASRASRARSSTPPSADHDHDLDGERAAVIGTGASAIQFVPRIAAEAVDAIERGIARRASGHRATSAAHWRCAGSCSR